MSASSSRSSAGEGFDPNAPGDEGRIWGLPFDVDRAALVLLPVPWEATVSYGAGTADGPAAILKASTQVDLYDSLRPDAWKRGIAMSAIPSALRAESDRAREHAKRIIDSAAPEPEAIDRVNRACERMVEHVRKETAELLDAGKLVATVGGDHSTPLGLMQNLGERHPELGILHIDAHCDLREAYEGFEHSHASIMFHALGIPAVTKLVQVGIRDYCEEERERIDTSEGRIRLFEHRHVSRRRFAGESWSAIRDEILSELPHEIYVSFDVDGLDPSLCPGTGTPVPGGLGYEEALYLIDGVAESGRSIIGFDLSEVAPAPAYGEWDANVGARLLYRLSCVTLDSRR
jgi:agmatinase